jgi:DNA-binding transcriptional MerR regulator
MAMPQPTKRALDFDPPVIPDRLYFKIGDAARICDVETHVLRFWETQFPQLKPNKSGNGQRLYRRRDMELALKIKQLVHIDGYTLAGARQLIEQEQRRPQPMQSPQATAQPQLQLLISDTNSAHQDAATVIARVRAELREIASLLSAPEPQTSRRRHRLAAVPTSGSLFSSF